MEETAQYLWPWGDYVWVGAVALLSYVTAVLVRRLPEGKAFLQRFRWPVSLANVIVAPLAVGALGQLVFEVFLAVGLSQSAALTIRNAAGFLVTLALAHAIGRVIEILLLERSAREGTALPQLERLLLYGLSLFCGLLIFLLLLGQSPVELFLSTSVVAAIVAFGLQQTLGDLFSGVALSLEKPFRPGDWIALSDGTEGEVVDVNWRATRLRGWDNATQVVPNSVIARQGFRNLYGAHHPYAPWYYVKLPAEVDPLVAKALLLEAVLRCQRIMTDPLPVVRLNDATTVPYTYMVWVHFPSYPAMFAGREQLFREIHEALRRSGIQVAAEIEEIRHRAAEPVKPQALSLQAAIKSVDVAQLLSDEDVIRIADMSQERFVDTDTVLLKERAVTDAITIVVSGIVESSISDADGHRIVVEQLKPGDYFGLASMMTGEPSRLEFRTVSDALLIRVDIESLRSVVADRPDLAELFAEIIQRRLHKAEEVRRAANLPARQIRLQDVIHRVEVSLGFRRKKPEDTSDAS